MKRNLTAFLLALASLSGTSIALAQAPVVQANIPFAFSAGKAQLPSGTYTIRHQDSGILVLSNKQGNVSAFALAAMGDNVRDTPWQLIFHRYGNRYFLSEIHGEPGEAAQVLYPTKAERRIQQEEAALRNQKQVEVALK